MLESWKIKFIRKLYFFEAVEGPFESEDVENFINCNSEISSDEGFSSWIIDQELERDFLKWLEVRGLQEYYLILLIEK